VGPFPPLGLMYLSAILKQEGHQVNILDGFFTNEEEILKEIEKGNYNILGISTTTVSWPNDQIFINKIRKIFPKTNIVIGGGTCKCMER
jgi:radical SAM superfamily enzyme YgiQ (UPF0313 family)